jgi:hypothetical protein
MIFGVPGSALNAVALSLPIVVAIGVLVAETVVFDM